MPRLERMFCVLVFRDPIPEDDVHVWEDVDALPPQLREGFKMRGLNDEVTGETRILRAQVSHKDRRVVRLELDLSDVAQPGEGMHVPDDWA